MVIDSIPFKFVFKINVGQGDGNQPNAGEDGN